MLELVISGNTCVLLPQLVVPVKQSHISIHRCSSNTKAVCRNRLSDIKLSSFHLLQRFFCC